jgi:hypothetical protein
MLFPIATFSVADKPFAVLASLPVPRVPVLRGMPYARAQGRFVSPNRIGASNSPVRSLMRTDEVPPNAILVDAQSVAGCNVRSEHLPAPATFEADDIIVVI